MARQQEGIVRRTDSLPERLGATRWFLLRFGVSMVVATVLVTLVVRTAALAYLLAVALAVVLAALVQLAAARLGMRPPKLDLSRRPVDVRDPKADRPAARR